MPTAPSSQRMAPGLGPLLPCPGKRMTRPWMRPAAQCQDLSSNPHWLAQVWQACRRQLSLSSPVLAQLSQVVQQGVLRSLVCLARAAWGLAWRLHCRP